jgi:probable HAF family extracellular repeat protein
MLGEWPRSAKLSRLCDLPVHPWKGMFRIMSKSHVGVIFAIVVWTAVMETLARGDAMYNITALTTPQAPINLTSGVAPGLNNLGQVVGYMPPAPNWQQGYGFVYNGAPGGNGSVTPLGGSTSPVDYPAIRNSQPLYINDSGQIIGNNTTPASAGSYYLYSNGQETALPYAPAMFNNAGQVISGSFTVDSNGNVSPILYNLTTGTQINVPEMPGATQTWAVASNGSGQVAGNTQYPTIQGGGFFYSNGTITSLGTLGGTSTTVIAMNSSGQVTGTSSLTGDLIAHAFLYSNGKLNDLGALPGFQTTIATGINDQGQVVGWATNPGSSGNDMAGFLYKNGVMTNLNSLIDPKSGWTILAAESINDLGQILATGYNPSLLGVNGSGEGYVLLTPSDLAAPGDPAYVTIVPEPSSLAVFGMIAAGLVLRLRRKKAAFPPSGETPPLFAPVAC